MTERWCEATLEHPSKDITIKLKADARTIIALPPTIETDLAARET
jgi:hypothetical protein